MSLGGLFAHRGHNQGRAFAVHRAQRRKSGPARDTAKLDAFAEALAEHGTVAAASREVGVCHQRGSQMLAFIREGLGWQAQ